MTPDPVNLPLNVTVKAARDIVQSITYYSGMQQQQRGDGRDVKTADDGRRN